MSETNADEISADTAENDQGQEVASTEGDTSASKGPGIKNGKGPLPGSFLNLLVRTLDVRTVLS